MNKETILAEIERVECALSPENLCMDGEASPAYVRREGKRLNKKLAELQAKLELFNK